MMKGINVQFQESEVPSRKNIKKSTLGHVIMRTSLFKDRDNLKSYKRKRD